MVSALTEFALETLPVSCRTSGKVSAINLNQVTFFSSVLHQLHKLLHLKYIFYYLNLIHSTSISGGQHIKKAQFVEGKTVKKSIKNTKIVLQFEKKYCRGINF